MLTVNVMSTETIIKDGFCVERQKSNKPWIITTKRKANPTVYQGFLSILTLIKKYPTIAAVAA